jgi:predicted acyl esterase
MPGEQRQTRRRLLSHIGVAAGGTVLPLAGSGRAAVTTTDRTIFSFDSTQIEATLYEPATAEPQPAVLATHGWGATRDTVAPIARTYAQQGYVVLTYDSRGFGDSGGVVTLTGENEQKDAQELITWLADHEAVLTDATGPRLGMDGRSYGGGIQLRVAAHDDRVDAIVPRYTWHDLTRALAPNGAIKTGWARGLLTLGSTTGDLDDDFRSRSEDLIARGDLTADDRQYFESRSTVGYPDDLGAATLVVQSFTDRLFPANEGLANYRWAQDNGVETALLLGNGGVHDLFGAPPPGAPALDAFAQTAALDWMDAHLRDGSHDLAPVTYYDPTGEEFLELGDVPPQRAQPRTFRRSLSSVRTLTGPDGGPLAFDWDIERETTLYGTPTLSLAVRPTGSGTTNLMAALQQVTDGEATTLEEQPMAAAVETATTLTFDLAAVQQTLAPGDRLRLALATGSEQLTDSEFLLGQNGIFADTSEGAGVEIQTSADIELTVPARVGPPPVLAGRAPRNLAGDGLYRDVRGDGRVDVLDVQTLFTNLDAPAVQQHAHAFNFSGTDPETVTVLDVQALFDAL